MMAKSGLEKIFLKSLHAQILFYFIERWIFAKTANSVMNMTSFGHGGISKKIGMHVHMINETLSH